jgi:hypothetical protein
MVTRSPFHRRTATAVERPVPSVPSANDAEPASVGPRGRRPSGDGADGRVAAWFALSTLLAASIIAATWTASTAELEGAAFVVRWLQAHNDASARAAFTTLLLATTALSFVVAWARASAPRRPVRLAGGRGTIAVAEVEQLLRDALLARPDLVDARVEVENRRRGLRVTAQLFVTRDAQLMAVIDSVTLLVDELVYDRLGASLAGAPRLDLRYDELDLRAGRSHDFGAGRAGRPNIG